MDTFIPLSTPIKTKSGRYVSEIPIREGQMVVMSQASFQRYDFQVQLSTLSLLPTPPFLDPSNTGAKMHTSSALSGGSIMIDP